MLSPGLEYIPIQSKIDVVNHLINAIQSIKILFMSPIHGKNVIIEIVN